MTDKSELRMADDFESIMAKINADIANMENTSGLSLTVASGAYRFLVAHGEKVRKLIRGALSAAEPSAEPVATDAITERVKADLALRASKDRI